MVEKKNRWFQEMVSPKAMKKIRLLYKTLDYNATTMVAK